MPQARAAVAYCDRKRIGVQVGQTFVERFVERTGIRGAAKTVPEPRAPRAESTVKKNGRSRILGHVLSHEFRVMNFESWAW
jgi:hypothetical protein